MNVSREARPGDGRVRSEAARYRYHRGGHELILVLRAGADSPAADVEPAGAEFALVVDGPWIVLYYRFSDSAPWSGTSPFNWHMTAEGDRVVPHDVDLTSARPSRIWSTLWISLVDPDSGEVHARRAVALRPEFTRALHHAIRAQALQPISSQPRSPTMPWPGLTTGAETRSAARW
ncbi:MAG: hypothetical protein JWN86_321 [Planctomycetota bacterium]|nr:hypothetical protein [Planctomycetota bacterium]